MAKPKAVTEMQVTVNINGHRTSMSHLSIEGRVIEVDHSGGAGHAWQSATADSCPPSIQNEIAGEIIDGEVSECPDYVASNGQHYRWK